MMDNLTLPSFAKDIFTSNYYDEDHEIKVIKGKLEDQIRTSYFGGMMHVRNSKEILSGFHYDMNSQYPNAMLQDMPTGNPVLTSEKDLNKLFGFTYGLITPPSESELKVPLLRQRISKIGKDNIIYPRNPFKAMIFTELIKEAIKYGYKFEVEFSYTFNRTEDVFRKYVEELYQDKVTATDVATRNISKLLLNSLYGKFGMNEIDSIIKIMPNYEAAQISNSYHVDYIHMLNSECSLVKYRGRLPNEARELFKDPDLNINVPAWTAKELSQGNVKGVQSSIPIANAIASYAAISMFPYMNIKDNNLIYMDTDSAVLEKPLSKDLIGKELGQMKLEYLIEKAVYADKKLYAVITKDGSLIKKAVGLNSNCLSYEDYVSYLNGKPLSSTNIEFITDLSSLTLRIEQNSFKQKFKFKAVDETKPVLETEKVKNSKGLKDKDKDKDKLGESVKRKQKRD